MKGRGVHTAFVGGGVGLAGLVFLFLTVQGPGGGMSAGPPQTNMPTVAGTKIPWAPASPPAGGADEPTYDVTEPVEEEPPDPTTWNPLHDGPVTLGASPLDLDRVPFRTGSGGDAAAIVVDGQVYLKAGKDRAVAKAPSGSNIASPEDCADLFFYEPEPVSDRVLVPSAGNVCLLTDQDRIGILYIRGISKAEGTVSAYAAVWAGEYDDSLDWW